MRQLGYPRLFQSMFANHFLIRMSKNHHSLLSFRSVLTLLMQ